MMGLKLILCLALSTWAAPSSDLLLKIRDAAIRSSLDPMLVEAIVKTESNFSPSAKSPKGALGLMQVMPSTADECEISAPTHALDNLMGACECLRKLINRYRGDLPLALAAYNAGTKAVQRYGGIPPFPETQKYVRRVLSRYDELRTPKKASRSRKTVAQNPR